MIQHIENTFQCVVEMCESQKGGIRGGFIETDGSTLRWVIFWLKMTIFIECPLLNTYNKQQNILNWELGIDYRFTTWLWKQMCNCFLIKVHPLLRTNLSHWKIWIGWLIKMVENWKIHIEFNSRLFILTQYVV